MKLHFEGIEMQKWKKWHIICIFCWRQQKISHSLDKTFRKVHLKDLFEFFQKMVWYIGFGIIICKKSRVEISKNCWVSKKIMKLCIFKGWRLVNGSWGSNNPEHFLRELSKIVQMRVNILSKLWLIFCWYQQKIREMSHSWHFNDHNLGSKHDN